MEYIQPGEYCVKSNGTCLLTTYPIPSRAIKVEAETSGGGMRPSLALDSSVRAAYLAGDGVRKLSSPVNNVNGLKAAFYSLNAFCIVTCRIESCHIVSYRFVIGLRVRMFIRLANQVFDVFFSHELAQ